MAVFQSLGTPQPKPEKVQNLEPSRTRKVLRYTMMPEILPRIRALGLHFGHFAYLLALVFGSARLIPQAHPVMNSANIGRFGVRQVIAIAANNLKWDRNHIDQIGIFSAIMIGLIMIIIQAGLIAVAALMGGEAQANAGDPGSFFAIPDASKDLNMIVFSQIFGDLSGFWGTGVSAPGSKSSIHSAVYAMLSLYSLATMVIAVVIVLYYILTVIGEAAKTGTPFGQRFNSLWAPIRLVVALGLLVPLGSGLNSAQYITLWMAKMGAGLGSQAWSIMAEELIKDNTTYHVQDTDLKWVYGATENIYLAQLCAEAYTKHNEGVNPVTSVSSKENNDGVLTYVRSWVSNDTAIDGKCGSVSITMHKTDEEEDTTTTVYLPKKEVVPTEEVFDASLEAVESIYTSIQTLAKTQAEFAISPSTGSDTLGDIKNSLASISDTVVASLATKMENIYSSKIEVQFDEILKQNVDRGWLSAGLWYIRVGQMIQSSETPKTEMIPTTSNAFSSVNDKPDGLSLWDWMFPGAQKEVYDALQSANKAITSTKPSEATKNRKARRDAMYARAAAADAASADACEKMLGYTDDDILGGMRCFIYKMITPESLLRLRSEPSLDPMATLITAGSEIITKAIVGVTAGFVAIAVGSTLEKVSGFIKIFPGSSEVIGLLAGAIKAAGHIFVLIGLAGFAAGLILFYMLPMFPFIYFFFAALSWFLEIIEAVIAMPLWALAHLRIEGDGMPGQAAMNGYYLLLAILIRPALIVIALALGYVAFGAAIFLLQSLFDPLIGIVNNERVYGFDLLIYTIIYAYLCYSIALVCFKLVDTVPNQILRWVGSGASTFSDGKQDPVGSSTGAVIAASAVMSQGMNSITGAGAATGSKLGGDYDPQTGKGASGLAGVLQRRKDAKNAGAGDMGGGASGGGLAGGGVMTQGVSPSSVDSDGNSGSGDGGGKGPLPGGTSGSATGSMGGGQWSGGANYKSGDDKNDKGDDDKK